MSETTTLVPDNTAVSLGVADTVIEGMAGRLVGLDASSPAGYEQCRLGAAEVRTCRTGVEKSRKEMVQDSVTWQKKVNAEAKRVTALLVAIENPLKVEMKRVDDEIARVRAEAEQMQQKLLDNLAHAEQARIDDINREFRKEKEAEEAAKKEQARAKLEARMEEERVERQEKQKQVDEGYEALRVERTAFEALREEHRALREECRKQEAEAAAAQKLKDDEARDKRIAAESAAAEKVRVANLEAQAPDKRALGTYVQHMMGLQCTELSTEWGQEELDRIQDALDLMAKRFQTTGESAS